MLISILLIVAASVILTTIAYFLLKSHSKDVLTYKVGDRIRFGEHEGTIVSINDDTFQILSDIPKIRTSKIKKQ